MERDPGAPTDPKRNWQTLPKCETLGNQIVRIASILLVVLGLISGCENQGSCVQAGANGEFGTNHLEKIDSLLQHAEESGLPTTKLDVARIVGVAYAVSQLEGGQAGVPVSICLRAGAANDTEYRVIAEGGKPLIEWQSTTKFGNP